MSEPDLDSSPGLARTAPDDALTDAAPMHEEAPVHDEAPVHTEAHVHDEAPVHTEAHVHDEAPLLDPVDEETPVADPVHEAAPVAAIAHEHAPRREHAALRKEDDEPAPPRVSGFRQLEDVILDESFPEVDLALRRGRHIHKGDERWYELLLEGQGFLEAFYRRYGCELEQRSDGYFFLLPVTDGLGKRHMGVAEMIVGQGLALCYLDPRSVQSGGLVTREELLNQLAAVMGTDALMRTLNPKRKRPDERVMQRTVRTKVNDALRRLSQLGFVELLDGEQLRLCPSLMRFAEPVRGLDAPSEALKRLIERGEVSLGPGDPEPDAADDADAGDGDTSDDADSGDDTHLETEASDAADPDASVSEEHDGPVSEEEHDEPFAEAAAAASEPVALPPELDIEWDTLETGDPPREEA